MPVLDETMLDWAHEADAASSAAGRFAAAARGCLAVARAAGVTTLDEVAHLPIAWLAGRIFVFALLPTLALCTGLMVIGHVALGLIAMITPGVLTSMIPAAVVLSLAWRPTGRALPAMGTAVMVFAAGRVVRSSTSIEPETMFPDASRTTLASTSATAREALFRAGISFAGSRTARKVVVSAD